MNFKFYTNSSFIPINNFINLCYFYNIISNTDGGGILFSNSNENIFLTDSIFYFCSALTSGGAFKIISNKFYQSKCCFILCNSRNYEGFKWGHSGNSITISNSFINLSTIIQCTNTNIYYGHFAFALDGGNQFANINNISNCYSVQIHSSFCFGRGISCLCILMNFYNISKYEALLIYDISNSSINQCNFIKNNVERGSIANYRSIIKVFNSTFYLNSNDLAYYHTAGSYELYFCKTDKLIFSLGITLNCEFNYYTNFLNKIKDCDIFIETKIFYKKINYFNSIILFLF